MALETLCDSSKSTVYRDVSVYRNKCNRVIIPVSAELALGKFKDNSEAGKDECIVDSIDSGVDLSYSVIDTDENLSSCLSCSSCDTDCDTESGASPKDTGVPSGSIVSRAHSQVNIFCLYDSKNTTDESGNAADSVINVTDKAHTESVTETEVNKQSKVQSEESISGDPAILDDTSSEFSSVVEIDGDCVIIHSRQEASDCLTTTTSPPPDTMTEKCRNFFRSRSRFTTSGSTTSRPLLSTAFASRKRHFTTDSADGRASLATSNSFGNKMQRLRREMSSLSHQDDRLLRQLLQLHNSIQTLRIGSCSAVNGTATVDSSGSSVCSLPEAVESCSPMSTLSSTGSRHSHLSSDSTGHNEVINPLFFSTPVLKSPPPVTYHPFATLSSGTHFGRSDALTRKSCSTKLELTCRLSSATTAVVKHKKKSVFLNECDLLPRTLSRESTSRVAPLSSFKQNKHQKQPFSSSDNAAVKPLDLKSSRFTPAPTVTRHNRDSKMTTFNMCDSFNRFERASPIRIQSSTTLPERHNRRTLSDHKM